MIDDIFSRFDKNISRVENLVSQYQPSGAGRTKVFDTDILRAALVLLHASLEDFLRSIQIWKAPLESIDFLNSIPLLGVQNKQAQKFLLGSLLEHREKSVDDLLRQSVSEYIEQFTSFNNIGDIKRALTQSGLKNVDDHDFSNLPEMISRRHKIVHRADRNNITGGKGNHTTASLSVKTLNIYIEAVKSLSVFVKAQLEQPK